jgi:GNAT superfamily N-acetyltransferase
MIRTAIADDLEGLRRVYRRASLSNEGDRENLLASPEVLIWNSSPGETRVAVDDAGAVLGFATVITGNGGRELDDLFVDPDRMRQGIAMQLVRDAALSAEADGVPWIEVTGNPHAAEFYAAAGFVYLGEASTLFGPAPRLRLTVPKKRQGSELR